MGRARCRSAIRVRSSRSTSGAASAGGVGQLPLPAGLVAEGRFGEDADRRDHRPLRPAGRQSDHCALRRETGAHEHGVRAGAAGRPARRPCRRYRPAQKGGCRGAAPDAEYFREVLLPSQPEDQRSRSCRRTRRTPSARILPTIEKARAKALGKWRAEGAFAGTAGAAGDGGFFKRRPPKRR